MRSFKLWEVRKKVNNYATVEGMGHNWRRYIKSCMSVLSSEFFFKFDRCDIVTIYACVGMPYFEIRVCYHLC